MITLFWTQTLIKDVHQLSSIRRATGIFVKSHWNFGIPLFDNT